MTDVTAENVLEWLEMLVEETDAVCESYGDFSRPDHMHDLNDRAAAIRQLIAERDRLRAALDQAAVIAEKGTKCSLCGREGTDYQYADCEVWEERQKEHRMLWGGYIKAPCQCSQMDDDEKAAAIRALGSKP